MSKREFTPEEIAESLSVCGKGGRPCDGCAVSGQGLNACLDIVAAAADLVKAQVAQIGELEAELTKLREENRWIPVEERLPATDDGPFHTDGELSAVEVLAVIEGAEWATELHFDGYDFFDIQGDELIPYRVTRWKPMPKGPEVGHE